MKQTTLAMTNNGFNRHGKTSKRAAFLARMEKLLPWVEFCRIDPGCERVQDATTLSGFRHLLEVHGSGAAMIWEVGELPLHNGLKLSGGTIVDATIIEAPNSSNNQDNARNAEMYQSKKGNESHPSIKLHIGINSASALIHSSSATVVNGNDWRQLETLLHGEGNRLYGDSACNGKKEVLQNISPNALQHL